MVGHHDQALRAPAFLGGGDAPAVLRRTDQRFVEGLFRDLLSDEGREALAEQLVPTSDDADKILFLPVHRSFQLALVEAYCLVPGEPRLDPLKIESAGLVVRRRVPVGAELGDRRKKGGRPTRPIYNPAERWMASGDTIRGWIPTLTQDERDEDPDPTRRHQRRTANAEIDALLAKMRLAADPDLAEVSTKLFPVPPDVCDKLGRTLLFAVIPVTDAERVEQGGRAGQTRNQAGADAMDLSKDDLLLLIPPWLRAMSRAPEVPVKVRGSRLQVTQMNVAGRRRTLVRQLVDGAWTTLDVPDPGMTAPSQVLTDYGHFVRLFWQVHRELGAFTDTDHGRALRTALARVRLDLPDGSRTDLANFLKEGARVFVLKENGASLHVPSSWPQLTATQAAEISEAVGASYRKQLSVLGGKLGRYDRHDARYELRAFMRVKRDDGCPPALVWSDEVGTFRLARWYEGGPPEAVTPSIELPTVNAAFLSKIRPNVTFKVPRSLFNFLRNNTPGQLIEGEASDDSSGPDFHWICGFNIPIITIVAFIVLFIFLVLLNIVFWWLPFVRICIPIPVVRGGPFDPDEG